MEAKRAYGVLAAVATRLGERARTEETLVMEVRKTPDIDAFRAVIREKTRGLLPDALVTSFVDEVVTDADWILWRARLLIQMKMVKAGAKPAPGHEAGRGVRKG